MARQCAAQNCGCPPMVNMIEDNDKTLGPWREAVGWAARMAYKGDLITDTPLVVLMEFVKPRPKSHYGTGRNAEVLKDSAPVAPIVKPDVLKLARAVEDALTGPIWKDDCYIVTELIAKRYCPRWEPERVNITIRHAGAVTVGDLVAAGQTGLPEADEEFEQLAIALA
jgi:Holliday junction resolvase RusA-like endonuclease